MKARLWAPSTMSVGYGITVVAGMEQCRQSAVRSLSEVVLEGVSAETGHFN
jgi:hypothetical protein